MVDLMEKSPSNGIYNMGSGQARSWNDLARAVFKSMNREMKIRWLDMPDSLRNQYQYFTEAKMQKWKAAGMADSHWSLEKAVDDYVQNYLMKDQFLL
jgi:ADP-L-glycero-D-manno-heptose 6-epimerase